MRIVLTIWLAIAVTAVEAQPVGMLSQPGVVALMRHALAPGTGDPEGFDLGSCATQRNLDARGRAQARHTGAALRGAGIRFDAVWTSQWCRTRETATLLDMGNPEERPALNSFYGGRGDRAGQIRAIGVQIAALPRDTRLLIVTHQVNITALTGLGVASGEIIVTRRTSDGLEPVGSFVISP
ncbi:histidine phosphatase family protein [Roseovarius ramblicola]|uniref:Histidine phosphatase family protein n=1 Tax=Roseovarius ramblicola TaxID=2022336 RepID=A0ABV5I150_9RHOB